jgi:hypothetical protein
MPEGLETVRVLGVAAKETGLDKRMLDAITKLRSRFFIKIY